MVSLMSLVTHCLAKDENTSYITLYKDSAGKETIQGKHHHKVQILAQEII